MEVINLANLLALIDLPITGAKDHAVVDFLIP